MAGKGDCECNGAMKGRKEERKRKKNAQLRRSTVRTEREREGNNGVGSNHHHEDNRTTYILPAGGAKCAEREIERNWIGRRGELDDRVEEKRWA